MNKQTIIDLSDSTHDFLEIVYPRLKTEGFIKGKLLVIESITNKGIALEFDQSAGIDAFLLSESGITGLASRIQWGDTPWNTFTIRRKRHTGAKTEYEKRAKAISSNGEYIYPFWTCQAYITERRKGQLLSVAIAKTSDIFKFIASGHSYGRKSDNFFDVVDWFGLKAYGHEVFIWPEFNVETPLAVT